MRLPRLVGALPLALALILPVRATADAALTARLSLQDPLSGAAVQAQDGVPVRLSVALTDVVTGQPPRGLMPAIFARRRSMAAPSCEQVARGYLSTGAVPGGAVDFGTPVLVSLMRDGAIGVADPRLNLQSANMIAAFRPPAMPGGIATDPARGRLILTQPKEGRVIALPVTGATGDGGTTLLAQGLTRPGDITVSGNEIRVATDGAVVRLGPDGSETARIALGPGRVSLKPGLAFSRDGAILLGDRLLRLAGPLADASPAGPGAVLSLAAGADRALLTYADAPDQPVPIPLGRVFSRIDADPDGRIAIAWRPGDGAFVLIDLARAAPAQAAAFSDGTLAEVLATPDMLYLLSLDGGFLGMVQPRSIRTGQSAAISRTMLGIRDHGAPEDGILDDSGDGRLLLSLGRAEQVMAVLPSSGMAFLIQPMMALNGQPPSDGTRLRGGLPHRVYAYERNFVETGSGRFEAVWPFAPGAWELVLTTGPLGFTTCLPFTVKGVSASADLRPVRLVVQPDRLAAGRRTDLRLQLLDAENQPVVVDSLPVLLAAMGSGWRKSATAIPATDHREGALHVSVELPHAGPFVLNPVALPQGLTLRGAAGLVAQEISP